MNSSLSKDHCDQNHPQDLEEVEAVQTTIIPAYTRVIAISVISHAHSTTEYDGLGSSPRLPSSPLLLPASPSRAPILSPLNSLPLPLPEKFSNQQNPLHLTYAELRRCGGLNLDNLTVPLSSLAPPSNRPRSPSMAGTPMEFLSASTFEEDPEDPEILKAIETAEEIYGFGKPNSNDLMAGTQDIEVRLSGDPVDQMEDTNQVDRDPVGHAEEEADQTVRDEVGDDEERARDGNRKAKGKTVAVRGSAPGASKGSRKSRKVLAKDSGAKDSGDEEDTVKIVGEFKRSMPEVDFGFTPYILKKMSAKGGKRSRGQKGSVSASDCGLEPGVLNEILAATADSATGTSHDPSDYIENEERGPKNHKRKATTRDIAVRNPGITRDVPKEERLDDDGLIELGRRPMSKEARWKEAPYCWNAKGLLYQEYKYLGHKKDRDGEYLWDDDTLKPFVPHGDVVLFRSRHANPSLMGHLGIRRRAPKGYVDQVDALGKYVAAKDSPEARKISESTIREVTYGRLQKGKAAGEKTMMRVKPARRAIEEAYEQSWATAVATDKWSKESKDIWLKANEALLQSHESLAQKNLLLIQEVKALRGENAVLENAIDDLMAGTSTAPQDLAESKLGSVGDQFTPGHDDAEHSAEDHPAEDLTEDIAENLGRDHPGDDNIPLEE